MKYAPTQASWEAYAQLPPDVRARGRQAFQHFRRGVEHPPFHPSLRIRKMEGYSHVWEGHVTRDYVFTFHYEQDPETGETICVFRSIGSHRIYRNP